MLIMHRSRIPLGCLVKHDHQVFSLSFRTRKGDRGWILLGSFAQKILGDVSLYFEFETLWQVEPGPYTTVLVTLEPVRVHAYAPPHSGSLLQIRYQIFHSTSQQKNNCSSWYFPAPANPHQSRPAFGVSTGNPWI